MAGVAEGIRPASQLLAIVRARWLVFAHSIQSKGGALELAARIFMGFLLLGGGITGAFGLGVGAHFFVTEGRVEWIAILLWSVFAFWQLFPIIGSVFTETVDLSDLLRFPLNYRSYFLVRLVYGALDPSTLMGCCWLTGILLGIASADVTLLPWSAAVLVLFGFLNISLMQMLMAWVERWLAQRRTREVFTVLFFLMMIGLQLAGPLAGRYGSRIGPELKAMGAQITPIQRVSPPGIAALSIARMSEGRPLTAVAAFGLLLAYSVLALLVMGRRVRAQYRGENLSEAPASGPEKGEKAVLRGWSLPLVSAGVSAVCEKELRSLARSAPMLLTLVTPVVMLGVFGLNQSRNGAFLPRFPALSYPFGGAYSLILLTNMVYNTFGSDGSGVQLYFASPMRIRTVLMGKNLAHGAIIGGELLMLWVAVAVMFRRPTLTATALTQAGMLFAAPVNFVVGNLLSVSSPKRVDFGRFGRQRAAQITVLISLIVQALVIAVGSVVFLVAINENSTALGVGLFLGLAAIAWTIYAWSVRRAERMAENRRDLMTAELCRAQ
jgi:ABC-2 type transport system permease protein